MVSHKPVNCSHDNHREKKNIKVRRGKEIKTLGFKAIAFIIFSRHDSIWNINFTSI